MCFTQWSYASLIIKLRLKTAQYEKEKSSGFYLTEDCRTPQARC